MTRGTKPYTALSNIRVLDMTEGVAGPYASSLLGDVGAEVIKIERPDGDWGRGVGSELEGGLSSYFIALNRNKRNLGLDMQQEKAMPIVKKLLQRSDVVLSNYRPGVMERLGMGYEDCVKTKPDIIYCTVSAFEQGGEYAHLPGNDTGLQAISGVMSLIGEPDGPPLRVSFPLIDFTAALFAMQGILVALHAREEGEGGRKVEVSLLNAALALQSLPLTEYLIEGSIPRRHGNQNPVLAPAGAFLTSDDRYVTISLLRKSHWPKFYRAIDRPDLGKDPRFKSNAKRIENRSELNRILEPVFRERSSAGWVKVLRAADVLCAPVNDFRDVVSDPGLAQEAPFSSFSLPSHGKVQFVANPIRFNGEFLRVDTPSPRKGEHTLPILRELSCSEEDIRSMLEDGVVFYD